MEQIKKEFIHFLNKFTSLKPNEKTPEGKSRYDYINQAEEMSLELITTIYISISDVINFNQDLAEAIVEEYIRYLPLLQNALIDFFMEHFPDFIQKENKSNTRPLFISFTNIASVYKIREMRTEQLGQLISMSGTVTRTTEVRPELLYGAFTCQDCTISIKDLEQEFVYSQPVKCSNPNCDNNSNWLLDIDLSVFVDWQRIKLQENATEIPAGSMPRHLDVIARNEEVEKAKPGDKCIFIGSLIVVPNVGQIMGGSEATKVRGNKPNPNYQGVVGIKSLGVRSLNYKLVFLANNVQLYHKEFQYKNVYDDTENEREAILDEMTEQEKQDILAMSENPNIYTRLAECIAPNIFGHIEIKRGILLMIMGGVHKETYDGIKLRGDINICIVGDPSTAKSQFLKFVCSLLPRVIYTCGKASSAAGLTASVIKDHETGEFGIEAGALMLADNGICCIDEFDKMDPKDQAAIHEAMEQQTISISKAGINATLNARASILAAANPVLGRYDLSKTLKDNIDISSPIMSRFDLFFIVTDTCDEAIDINMAKHILAIHQKKTQVIKPPFDVNLFQNYIRYAKAIKPEFSEESYKLAINYYKELRSADCGGTKSAYRITVRQLESIIRLSEALARVELKDIVLPIHVKEAARLLNKSIIPIYNEEINLDIDFTEETMINRGSFTEIEANKTLAFDEYRKITNLLVYHIRREEEKSSLWNGIKEKMLLKWFLEQGHESGMYVGEEEGAKVLETAKIVIKRLIYIDKILVLTNEIDDDSDDENRMLDVHPNYDPENFDSIKFNMNEFDIDNTKDKEENNRKRKEMS